MGTRPIRFRVENNKSKSNFWYTLVAGNGDTVMTSKASYSDKASAKRAAKRMIEALGESQLVLEYEESDGSWVQVEQVPAKKAAAPQKLDSPPPGEAVHVKLSHEPPQVSYVPAAEGLNPNR